MLKMVLAVLRERRCFRLARIELSTSNPERFGRFISMITSSGQGRSEVSICSISLRASSPKAIYLSWAASTTRVQHDAVAPRPLSVANRAKSWIQRI